MTRILFTETAFNRIRSRLGAMVAQLEYLLMDGDGIVRLDGQEISPAAASVDGAWFSIDALFTSIEGSFLEILMASTALEWVQSAGAGVDRPVFAQLAGKGIRLTTNHSQAVGISEYILWGVLNHFQGGNLRAAKQVAHLWTQAEAREITGSRWLIVGFGAIGEAVARLAKGFDVHVTGVRRKPARSPFADVMATPDQVFGYLGESDVVVLCMPQTPQTVNMVDAAFLAAMKPGSMLVNVGRGSLIDDDALRVALDGGKPEHALLDVFRSEPLPADSWFWDHPRVTVTAHTSAYSSRLVERGDGLFLDNLARYLAGQALLNEISAAEVLAASINR